LEKRKIEEICVIFLTDGQPNEGEKKIQEMSKELKSFL
jgi:hypothetical protein